MPQPEVPSEYRIVRLEPDTKSAESLSRRLWKGRPKFRAEKDMAGSRVYRHEREE
jgi:hypothetical protein